MEDHQCQPPPQKIKLLEINSYLTCYLCKGYLIDATAISECLHSFCRSCIIKFLEENSYCPVCEMLINNAKPNLKLDKTLQDIVYKLVPGLFTREMLARKRFYQRHPGLAQRVTPEQRGEDTERIVFNPQDEVSLSLEYVSDDSTPGAIKIPATLLDQSSGAAIAEESLMKRYLQCPGMCRVDVLKKFVRNKYQVDTASFHIDILYKRVPLPDHYTLIDIAYIYSWKRNAPMKFYFRITDINKVAERFDYFDASKPVAEVVQPPPVRPRTDNHTHHHLQQQNGKNRADGGGKGGKKAAARNRSGKSGGVAVSNNKIKSKGKSNNNNNEVKRDDVVAVAVVKRDEETKKEDIPKQERKPDEEVAIEEGKDGARLEAAMTGAAETVKTKGKTDDAIRRDKKEDAITTRTNGDAAEQEETPNKTTKTAQNGDPDPIKSNNKAAVYTNITLNRTDNVEIITKIQKVSNKEGQPIGLNIIKHTVKKGNKITGAGFNNKESGEIAKAEKEASAPSAATASSTAGTKIICVLKKDAVKSVKVTANGNADGVDSNNSTGDGANTTEPKQLENGAISSTNKTEPHEDDEEKSRFLKSFELTAANGKKQSLTPPQPAKSSNSQKRKNPSPLRLGGGELCAKKPKLDPASPKSSNSELKSLFDSCKINIPSSLSITLKDGSEGDRKTLVPPVKNYIQILKLPDEPSGDEKGEAAAAAANKQVKSPARAHSFQKIFEESIKKIEPPSGGNGNIDKKEAHQQQQQQANSNNKKTEQEAVKVAIPRLNVPKVAAKRVPKYSELLANNCGQSYANLHSSALGLNYTVSITQTPAKSAQFFNKSGGGDAASPKIETSPVKKEVKLLPRPSCKNNNNNNNPIKKKIDFDNKGTGPRPLVLAVPPTMSSSSSSKASPKSQQQQQQRNRHHHHHQSSVVVSNNNNNNNNNNSHSNVTKSSSTSTSTSASSSSSSNSSAGSISNSGSSNLDPSKVQTKNGSPKSTSNDASSSPPKAPPALNPSQLLEKYNIQNLAQLTASLSGYAPAGFAGAAPNLAAFQQAVFLKQIEMHQQQQQQSRQNWLNMGSPPLLQYENYLKSLGQASAAASSSPPSAHLLGNIKEN